MTRGRCGSLSLCMTFHSLHLAGLTGALGLSHPLQCAGLSRRSLSLQCPENVWISRACQQIIQCTQKRDLPKALNDGRANTDWNGVKEPIIAGCHDLARGMRFWIPVIGLHFIQLWVLRFGWSPFVINWLDTIEGYAVVISFAVLLLGSVLSFGWSEFRRLQSQVRKPPSDREGK